MTTTDDRPADAATAIGAAADPPSPSGVAAISEFGQLLCPLPGHGHDDDRHLCLERHHSFPIYTTSTDEEMTGDGNTSAWEVRCVGGHVLAVSQGEENAEPVPMAWLLDTLGALGEVAVTPQPGPYDEPEDESGDAVQ